VLELGEIRLAGADRGLDELRAVVFRVQTGDERVLLRGGLLALGVERQARLRELRGERVQVAQAQDGRERVVERGQRVEHRRQLGVGQERPERGQVAVPAVLVEDLRGGGAAARVPVRHAVRPLLRERDRRAAFELELRGDARRPGVMQALPRLAPRLRALLPALERAGHQQLQALRERGLAGAVAAHHDGQAGSRLQLERRRPPDPAEPLDRDLLQPHRRRALRGRRRRRGVRRELDHPLGLVVEVGVLEPVEQQRAQDRIHLGWRS
jgi:hypothetical protein